MAESDWKTHNMSGTDFRLSPRYEPVKILGSGAYGVVVCALDKRNNNEKVAIKKLHKLEDIIDAKRILREIRILRCLKHDNILNLLNLLYDNSNPDQEFGDIYLVTNYMEIDLYKVIKSKQKLTDEHVQYIIYQIVRGLHYMHSANVIHRDLKPSNILATENCDIKMCDFGLARNIDLDNEEGLTEYVVTRYYRAPEVMLSSHEYAKPLDIWSVGCTFAELVTGTILFSGENYIKQIKLIFEKLGKPSEENMKFITNQNAKKYIQSLPDKPITSVGSFIKYENKHAIDLLDKMLAIDPKMRVTAEEALKHPYFESLHDPDDEPTFAGTIDFKFESDPKVTMDELRADILEEYNIYKRIQKEAEIDIKKELLAIKDRHDRLSKLAKSKEKK